MYGNKELPKFIDVNGFTGKNPNKKINIDYFITEDEFYTLHRQERKNIRQIIKEVGFEGSDTAFKNAIKRLGWKKEIGNIKIPLDETFFKTWNREMAWVLGWIITDGYVNKRRIVLDIKDKDVLEKIKALTSYEGTIKDSNHGKHVLSIDRSDVCEDIFSLGVPRKNKTFDCKFPEVPYELKWDFIRGAFEGDGSIFFEKGNIRMYICGASKGFIDRTEEFLNLQGIETRLTTVCKKNEMYYLHAKNQHSALLWCYLMYLDTDENIRMDRKYNKFAEYLDIFYDGVRRRRNKESVYIVELSKKDIILKNVS